MLCDYSYQMNNNKILGRFQAEIEDFKKFFRKVKDDTEVRSIVVEIYNSKTTSEFWIWQRPIYSQKIKKFVGGWQFVGRKPIKNS